MDGVVEGKQADWISNLAVWECSVGAQPAALCSLESKVVCEEQQSCVPEERSEGNW